MKKIPNIFEWYPRDFWYWPEEDEKLLQVIHQVHDLDQVLPLIPNKRVCIQAGGACGVWPVFLSNHFEYVFTFEPNDRSFVFLEFNVGGISNICKTKCVLSNCVSDFSMIVDDGEKNNIGAFRAVKGGKTGSRIIDAYANWCDVDFICLDVEGCEEDALRGAKETIERCNPVIMIEEKPLPHLKPGEHLMARNYLQSMGYKEVLRVNRDVVFKR